MAPIWVTGATGLLGGWTSRHLRSRGCEVFDDRVDLEDAVVVERTFHAVKPSAIVHCAAISAIADCARDPERARRINVEATGRLAKLSAIYGTRLVYVSSDLVFDGEAAPYVEDATTGPTSTYGTTKADAEVAVLCASPDRDVVVARISLLYGPTCTTRRGFFDTMADALRTPSGPPLRLFEDEWRTPLSLRRAAQALHLLVGSDVTGIVHVGGPERMSRLDMGRRLAAVLGVSDVCIAPARRSSAGGEPRPRDVSLDSRRFRERFAFWLTQDDFETECRAMGASEMRTSDAIRDMTID
jgi:dTDP-4-dehydrorhamnose reductase